MFAPARLRSCALICCVLLIVFGLACRFYNLKWDDNAHIHPDERFVVMTVVALKPPASLAEYFNTEISGLNPFHTGTDLFIYGQLPLNLCKVIALHWPGTDGAPNADNYNDVLLVGRFLSALFDAGTVLLVIWIGWKLSGVLLGALGGALLAVVPLHVQQSHFFTVDNFATFFLVAAFGMLVCASQAPKKKYLPLLFSGLFFGAACACKISALLFGAVFVFWAMLTKEKGQGKQHLMALACLFVIAFWTFRVFHPIAFHGNGGALSFFGALDLRPPVPEIHGKEPYFKEVSFWRSFAEQAAISRGENDPPWNWQWLGYPNYIWPLRNLALWAIGWPLLLAGSGGIALALKRFREPTVVNRHLLVAALWCFAVFGYYGGQYSKFTRYYLVMTPFFCLLAGWFLLSFARKFRAVWTYVLVAAVPVLTALWCVAVVSIYARPHTRMEATQWIWENVPAKTPVGIETGWDDPLPIGDARGLVQMDLDLFNVDDRRKREQLLDRLDKVEWIFMSSNHVKGIVTRVPKRWLLTTEYYRALFAGELGFQLEKEFISYPQLFGREFPDDNIEEALTLYDHPHVWLWRKTPAWSRERAAQILNESLCDQADSRPLKDWLK